MASWDDERDTIEAVRTRSGGGTEDYVEALLAERGSHPWYRNLGEVIGELAELRAMGPATLEQAFDSLRSRRRSPARIDDLDHDRRWLDSTRELVTTWQDLPREAPGRAEELAALDDAGLLAERDLLKAAELEAALTGMTYPLEGEIRGAIATARRTLADAEILRRMSGERRA